ncbi:ABC transporter permease [Paenibacillus agaridevorans]|uniref:ABC transporter permease n=1 Tax=Paenibacillus agaridevorans TaxID=171404 RepID=UPI001BE4C37C|nr:ABC transporter permease [Paenibacillus agaridevorans]
MLNLIKLELRKGHLKGYAWGSLLAYGIIAGFLALIYFTEGPISEEPIFASYPDMLEMIDVLVRATFIIYGAALLSKLVISEFRDKTMGLLFAYPVSRKKLMYAKLSIVFIWTFTNVVIANVLVDTIFLIINENMGYVDDQWSNSLLYEHGLTILMQAIGAAGISLLPLLFGMRKKSVVATIVSAVLIVMLVASNNMGFTLSSIIAIPLSLSAIGVLLAFWSFRDIDKVDVG